MGNLVTKQTISIPQLQNKFLTYIFDNDGQHDNSWDSYEVGKNCRKLGFISLEHFLGEIPIDIVTKYKSKSIIRNYGIGSRFVVKNDPGVRGKCVDIQIGVSSEENNDQLNHEIVIVMILDQPKHGSVIPSLLKKYPIHDLFLETHYFENVMKIANPQPTSITMNESVSTRLTSSINKNIVLNRPKTEEPRIEQVTKRKNLSSPKLYSVVAGSTALPKQKKQPTMTGTRRGIHGANNSCYMDSLLFALFYTTNEFDEILLQNKSHDSENAQELRQLLNNNAAVLLRTELYCPSSNINRIRSFLAKFDDRFQGAMMDIEELVYILVQDILEEPHFFQYDNGNQDYVHQILIDSSHETMATYNDETIDVQSCLEKSFKHWGDLKLTQCPKPGFFIQLPRSNGDLIRYCGILPNVALNLEEIITVNREMCFLCHTGNAEWECRDKLYCTGCIENETSLDDRKDLTNKNIIQLYAIICINSAHYTVFVKCKDSESDWFYFDSMAGSYPEIQLVQDFGNKLRQAEEALKLNNGEILSDPWVKKAMNDCHICIYLPTRWSQ